MSRAPTSARVIPTTTRTALRPSRPRSPGRSSPTSSTTPRTHARTRPGPAPRSGSRPGATSMRVVSFVCDTGTRYLSKVYNDNWMIDQGLLGRPHFGDLRDLVGRQPSEGNVISVRPDETLLTAFQRMRIADVSQLPVLDGD